MCTRRHIFEKKTEVLTVWMQLLLKVPGLSFMLKHNICNISVHLSHLYAYSRHTQCGHNYCFLQRSRGHWLLTIIWLRTDSLWSSDQSIKFKHISITIKLIFPWAGPCCMRVCMCVKCFHAQRIGNAACSMHEQHTRTHLNAPHKKTHAQVHTHRYCTCSFIHFCRHPLAFLRVKCRHRHI